MTEHKVRWCVVVRGTNQVICYEDSLYEALEITRAVSGLDIQIEVTVTIRRDPTHSEMAQELCLPEWADAVSGGGN